MNCVCKLSKCLIGSTEAFYKELLRVIEHVLDSEEDGMIIWDSLGTTSNSSRSHQEIGLERIYLEVLSRISSHNVKICGNL